MPAKAKTTLDVAAAYQRCVQAAGAVGSTVQKVDNGELWFLNLKV